MVLFLSDLHLGRGTPGETREAERDALALLRAHAEDVQALYLVGDVFDQYLEYRHLVPKGSARLLGLLAEWTDRGVAVTYLAGNRDPWHLGYFRDELGVRVALDHVEAEHHGRRLWVAHGDAVGRGVEPLYRWLRPLMRNRWIYRLYRNALPGDAAYRLARRVGRWGADPEPDAALVAAMRDAAHALLHETDRDLVVMGHCHLAQHVRWPAGAYLNPGYFFHDRTFAWLDAEGAHLGRWTGASVERLDERVEIAPAAPPA